MRRTIWAMGASALLLGSLAVVLATNVVGQDFEHQGAVTEAGRALTLDWRDDEAGKLRLELAPMDGAVSPMASLSLFSPTRSHLGTYTLDAEWPALDYVVQGRGAYTLVVHQAVDSTVDVLAEEGRTLGVRETKLSVAEETILEGEHTAVAYQVALERPSRDVHMGLSFEGEAEGLVVEAINSEGDTVLSASAASISTAAGETLVPELSPDRFTPGSLLVRVTADTFNGTLALSLAGFERDVRHAFIELGRYDAPEEEASDDEDAAGNDTGASEDDADVNGTAIEGAIVTELHSGVPVAFDAPDGVEAVYIVGRDGAGVAALFDPEDALVGVVDVSSETEGAIVWDEDDWLVAVPIPMAGAGEHVVLLRSSYGDGILFLPGVEPADAPEARELELEAVEIELNGTEDGASLFDLVLRSSSLNGTATLDGGLIGASVYTDGIDLTRTVRITGPDGEVEVSNAVPLHDELCPYDLEALGSAGDYSVQVDREAVLSQDHVVVELITYVR